ncbi:MAG: hypothetical protein J2P15_03135 [Micromonosporaceae bacterium]|nr:hypothetical protein [Micromonosporaceae bacterium]
MSSRSEVVLIGGRSGVGKSTVATTDLAAEIITLAGWTAAGIPRPLPRSH